MGGLQKIKKRKESDYQQRGEKITDKQKVYNNKECKRKRTLSLLSISS